MSREDDVRTFASYMRDWPTWLLVVLFIIIAICLALAGKLDDWLRAILALSFAGVAFALAAKAHVEVGARMHPAPPPPPPPPPEVEPDAG